MANQKIAVALALACLALTGSGWAQDLDYRWGVGLNLPGLGVRYFPLKATAVELRVQGEENVFVAGTRIYQYWGQFGHLRAFAGAEADLISAKGELSQGRGWAGEVMTGVEFFFWEPFSLQADLGPAWVFLRDESTGLQAGGSPEWVVNVGLNWYFGKE
jgi:hypothetical protein